MIELIGYNDQINLLLNSYKTNNLHSSIILHGPKGIGKKLFVYKFISEIIKLNFKDKNYLHHINLLKNNSHPNIRLIKKEINQKTKKLNNSILINQVRNLKKFCNESSSIKDINKIIIIDSADDLNINSANSLLKTLEEPKKNTLIFLISHQLSSLLPTIRSRCLKVKFNKHSYENFKSILDKQINEIKIEEIEFYYDLTSGSPGNSISFHNSNLMEIFDMTLNIFTSENINNQSIELSNLISKLDNDSFKNYLSLLKSIIITLNKLKFNDFELNNYLSNKFKILKKISESLTKQNLIDRFDFLSNNENDLFTYNLDKKLFMLKFLTS